MFSGSTFSGWRFSDLRFSGSTFSRWLLAVGCSGMRGVVEEFAEGGADPGGLLGAGIAFAAEAVLQLLGDPGDQRVLATGGELFEFFRLGGLLAFALESQAQQPLLQVIEQLLITAMARQAEAAADLQAQQIAGDPAGGEAIELPLEAIEIVVTAEADLQVVPAKPPGGQGAHDWDGAALEVHQQHLESHRYVLRANHCFEYAETLLVQHIFLALLLSIT